ncbi:G-protein coupled receptor family C group 6 member A-like [Spea bombifrons]|uniref:G-protein coupled receptor family C group 6 member A-like n=1 Tax=Spea bombifrons TaxID=233779 RepID=UPI00234AFC14|nr:G-protein coupled receptor family C group 6 member A-like [Spea bombifrons]
MIPITPWLYFLFGFTLGLEATMCNRPNGIVAKLNGDIMIGGLFPIHKEIPNLGNYTQPYDLLCAGFEMRGFIRSLGMVHAIERINKLNLLPGITLGYEIYDTCGDASKGLHQAMRFISQRNEGSSAINVTCNYRSYTSLVKAVIGAGYSEVSIAVSRLFSFQLIPQISYSSSADILSDKRRYPSFLRTVASDVHLTNALAKLIKMFDWSYVGIISSDDDYGRSVLESLMAHFDTQLVCTAFKEKIPADFGNPGVNTSIKEVIDKIKKSPARAVILALKVSIVLEFFNEIIKEKITRTWIAGDNWSTSREVASMEGIHTVGDILGLSFKNGEIPGFRPYLQHLHTGQNATNSFIEEYKHLRFGCTDEYEAYKQCLSISPENCTKSDAINFKSPMACRIEDISQASDDYLERNIELDGSYSAYLAVTAIAHALKNMLCYKGICAKNISFAPWELLHELKKVQFYDNDEIIFFDEKGNSNLGYDLLSWQTVNGSVEFIDVGEYEQHRSSIQLNSSEIVWTNPYNKRPESRCSDPCLPGQYKIHSDIRCCYNCGLCAEGYYSSNYDVNQCTKCPDDQWSLKGSSHCQNRTVIYFSWSDPFAIILTSAAGIGVVLVLVIGIVFLKNINTPAVKAAGGIYTCVMNLSLMASFATTVFFIGEPFNLSCKIRQPLYGISFTLCVSCILMKSFRIVLAFELGTRFRYNFKFTYQPVLVIAILTGVQIGICILWLAFNGPSVKKDGKMPQTFLLLCDEGSSLGYGTTLGYTGFLAFVCFVLAYKGRKLPDKYNEGKFITFSMLVYLFVWFAFIPIYVTTTGKYLPAVELVAILASNYGVICCHLIPTSYIIFFKKKENNREEYLQSVRSFSKSKISVSYLDLQMPNLETKACQTCPLIESTLYGLSNGLRKWRNSF